LFDDLPTRDLVGVKFFDSETTPASDGCAAFCREIDALVLRIHPSVLRIVRHCLAARECAAQIGTGFAAGGSPPEALPRLVKPGKAVVVVGLVLGMKFIHSRGVVHRYLKPENVMLDERGHPKIGDLGAADLAT
jgi:serine/threonine protein kinase